MNTKLKLYCASWQTRECDNKDTDLEYFMAHSALDVAIEVLVSLKDASPEEFKSTIDELIPKYDKKNDIFTFDGEFFDDIINGNICEYTYLEVCEIYPHAIEYSFPYELTDIELQKSDEDLADFVRKTVVKPRTWQLNPIVEFLDSDSESGGRTTPPYKILGNGNRTLYKEPDVQ